MISDGSNLFMCRLVPRYPWISSFTQHFFVPKGLDVHLLTGWRHFRSVLCENRDLQQWEILVYEENTTLESHFVLPCHVAKIIGFSMNTHLLFILTLDVSYFLTYSGHIWKVLNTKKDPNVSSICFMTDEYLSLITNNTVNLYRLF